MIVERLHEIIVEGKLGDGGMFKKIGQKILKTVTNCKAAGLNHLQRHFLRRLYQTKDVSYIKFVGLQAFLLYENELYTMKKDLIESNCSNNNHFDTLLFSPSI